MSFVTRVTAILLVGLVWASPLPADPRDVVYVDDDSCPSIGSGAVDDPYCSIQTAICAITHEIFSLLIWTLAA